LIANLRPQVVLVSVSADDLQDLPSPETLGALQGYTVLRTDRNGWIELSTDGEQM
jgi:beta-lactamase superfamily II metal-dependent hydrolase